MLEARIIKGKLYPSSRHPLLPWGQYRLLTRTVFHEDITSLGTDPLGRFPLCAQYPWILPYCCTALDHPWKDIAPICY